MTSLLVEHFQAPSGTHERRVLRYAREQALAALAGRTVWLAAQSAAAHRLRNQLAWAGDDGVASGWFGRAVDDDLAADVRPDDIVVLQDPATAEALRQRGAHVIAARIDHPARAVDAYLLTATRPRGALLAAAAIPCAGIVTAVESRGADYRDIGWGRLLADVVARDREECVGGRLHPRPAVAAR